MKNNNRLILFLLIIMTSCAPQKEEGIDQSQPNIVFIFADDQTYTSIGALGNDEIQTPNLDKIVKNGTTFTHAYNMGGWNGAVCVASRAMMISGRSVWRANQFTNSWREKDSTALTQTWGKIMESNGYDTYMTGKWHVAAPAGDVFQNVAHIRPGMPRDAWGGAKMGDRFKKLKADKSLTLDDIMPVGYNRPKDKNDNSWTPADTSFGGFWQGGKHWSAVLKDDAVGFIQQAKVKENPFFMYLAFNAPHDPRQAPQEYVDKYSLEDISAPESWLPLYPYKDDIGNGPGLRDEALAPFPRTEFAIKTHIKEYYASITYLDTQVGLILDELEASGKMDNTIVIFSADHGLSVGRHGLIGKQSLFDHSIRVPLMVMGKDIPKGAKVDADVYLQDVMATALDLAHIEKPDYVEFNSLLDLAKGKVTESNYTSIYGVYVKFQRMIRKDDYKLIVYPKIDKVLLFDMKNDPEEMIDLSGKAEYKEKVVALLGELIELQEDFDDDLDLKYLLEDLKS